MRYGVPYKGSKNAIAEWVYSHLPKRANFYDLFAGGCAITQIALMRGEYSRYFCNDIDAGGIHLFLDAIYGKYANERRWISREDFCREKDKDPYIKYCWSFGNNGRDYLYAREIEPYKRAWHYAILLNDFEPAERLGVNLRAIANIKDIAERYSVVRKLVAEHYTDERNIEIERLQQIESLNRLQSLQSLQSDYSAVEILPDSVIFCDIPYIDTNAYGKENKNTFDYERFYAWAESQKEFVFICEYTAPENRFVCIDSIEKSVGMNSGAALKATEKIFIPKHQVEMYRAWETSEGGSLFDFMELCG